MLGCEVDFGGVGLLEILCRLWLLIMFGVSFIFVGVGILEIEYYVFFFCFILGCEIIILLFGNFILGCDFLIKGGMLII